MAKTFPRPWSYVVLTHQSLGPGEAEINLRAGKYPTDTVPSKFKLMTEYMADIEILAAADVFIGSYSNVYITVAALRTARGMSPKGQTCYLDIRGWMDAPALKCEGSEEAKDHWWSLVGGYNGGSPF